MIYSLSILLVGWAPNELNQLPKMHFEFSFNLIGKSTMAINKAIMAHNQILVHIQVGGPQQGFQPRFMDGLDQFSSVHGTG